MADCVKIQQSLKALCCDGESVTGQASVVLRGPSTRCQLYDPDDGTWLTPGTIGIFVVGAVEEDAWVTCPLPCLDQITGPAGETAYDLGFYYEIKVTVDGQKVCTYEVALDCATLSLVDGQVASLEDVIILSPVDTPGSSNSIFVQAYETVTSLVYNNDNTYTYTNEEGAQTTFAVNGSGGGGGPETVTSIVDNNDGTFTYTNEEGTEVVINYGGAETITTLTNVGRTYTYTNEDGVTKTFDGGPQVITSIADNGDKSFTFTNEASVDITIDFSDTTTTLVDNGDGTFTYTNEEGASITFDGSSCSPFEDVLCDESNDYEPVFVTGIINPTNGTFRAGPVYTNTDGSSYSGLLSNLKVCGGTGESGGGSSDPFDCDDLNTCSIDALSDVESSSPTNGYVLAWSSADSAYVPTPPSILSETATTMVDNGNGTFTYTNEAAVATTFRTIDKEKIIFSSGSLVTFPSASAIDIDDSPRSFYAYAVTVAVAPTGDETFNLVDVTSSNVIASGTLTSGSQTTGIVAVTPYTLSAGNLLQANILTANGSEKFTLYAFYKTGTSELGV